MSEKLKIHEKLVPHFFEFVGFMVCKTTRAVHEPYFTNDPIFGSCALKRASTRILGFADILELVFPSDVGCD